ncbi:MAG TPA: glycoside hydrolase family 9 protein [Catenuloplanes sp.]
MRSHSRRRTVAIGATVIATAALTGLPPTAANAAEVEQVRNGTFDTNTDGWWSTPNAPIAHADGRLCADVPAGTVNRWDAIIAQNDIPLVKGQSYRLSFSATGVPAPRVIRALVGLAVAPYDTYYEASPELSVSGNTYSYTFTANTDTTQGQVAFQVGGNAAFRLCLDNVSLLGGVPPEIYRPDTGPRVRVNQVAYLPQGPKNATVVTAATTPLPWQLKNAKGATVARGKSRPRGVDASSGQNVHSVDFSSYRNRGAGFTLLVDGETSRPFDIDASVYEQLRTDALKFYYTQRSGIEILESLRPGYGRPAGHVNVAPNTGDIDVPCQPGVCDYTLNVKGGWYDAGDHGKYVVNGGISVYGLLSEFERTQTGRRVEPRKLGDNTLAIPESGNGVPDILDEARWELEFLLSMQVPADKPLAGMVHHKIHDANWTGLPLLPHLDPQLRELHPVSTAATLNLAATAAHAARLYKKYDAAFAARALAAAKTAYAAAKANPVRYALDSDGNGGGAYGDQDVTDEFYWAAAELFITTAESTYSADVLASPVHTADIWRTGGFDWGYTAAPGRLDLATVPNRLPGRAQVRASVLAGADRYLATQKAHPYGMPYGADGANYAWGSAHLVINNAIVIATAYDLTGQQKYRDGVFQSMDYILGRNALNISYVTGYGEVHARNQHSRWYANQLDSSLPNPPRGTLAGGPNSAIQDPVAQAKLQGCVGQFCYIDDIQSWATNELTINWNAPLAWIASFIADQNHDR